MTQNNEREALLNKFREIIAEQGWQCRDMTEKLIDAAYAHIQSPISQNEQQEAVGEVVNERGYSEVFVDFFDKPPPPNGTKLYTSPPKQIPDDTRRLNWIENEIVSIDTYDMDDSFGWIFTQYYLNEKEPREIYRSFTEDLRKSIDQAMLNSAPTNTEVVE